MRTLWRSVGFHKENCLCNMDKLDMERNESEGVSDKGRELSIYKDQES